MSRQVNVRQLLSRKCALLGIPVSGIFELTPRCNLTCKMCYVRLTGEDMKPLGRERTAEAWIRLAREARDAGMAFVLLTGGEPTLRPDFCEIYEAIAHMGISITINTNGSLLSPKIRELWHRLPPAQVNVTLYGTSREDYQALCGNADVFGQVTDGVDWLRREGIFFHLNATIVPTNYDKWEALETFAREKGTDLRLTTYCFPPTRRDRSCFERLEPEAAAELMVKDIYFREGAEGILKRARDLDTPLPRSCDPDADPSRPMQCLAGRGQFWVTWKGTMTPCAMLTTPEVDCASGFMPAWEQLRQLCAAIRLSPECTDCPDRKSCMNCAAVVFSENGNFTDTPQYMCRMNRAYRKALPELAERLS